MNSAKDLTKVPPTSARERVSGYVILARMADKGRSEIAGTVGEYNFDCPLDNVLFDFKNVHCDEVKKLIESGASNEQIAEWFDENGDPKSEAEKKEWSDKVEAHNPSDDPEKREWFEGACKAAGLDPATTTLFDFLDADDKSSYA